MTSERLIERSVGSNCYAFLTRFMYNAAMKKGIIKEENVPKISVIAQRETDEFDNYIVKKFIEKKKRKRSN